MSEEFWNLESISILLSPNATYDIVELNDHSQLDIRIYPNPFTDFLQIELKLERQEPVMLKILDILGKTVYQQCFALGTGLQLITIPATDLKPGMYLVSVRSSTKIYPVVNKVIH